MTVCPHFRLLILLVAVLTFSAATPGHAATRTWLGGGLSTDLADPTNWVGGVAPVSGDSIVFSGTSQSPLTNTLPAGFLVSAITFDPSAFFSFSGNSITLGGDITDNSRNHTEAFTLITTFNATHTINIGYGATLNFSGITDGAGVASLIKTGVGLLNLNGNNNLDGPLIIMQGTVAASTDARLGPAPATPTPGNIVLDGGALRFTASTLTSTRGIALGDAGGGFGTLDVSQVTYDGIIANNGGTGSLVKTGGDIGTGGLALTLGGASTYTGSTTINQGAIKLDFSRASAPAGNILYNGVAPGQLILGGVPTKLGNVSNGGGSLIVQAKAGATNSQTFSGLTLNEGNNQISPGIISAAGATLQVNLGAITHNPGGMVTIGLIPTGYAYTFTTTTGNTNGILGAWALIAGGGGPTAWAANDGSGNIVAYSAYTDTSGTASAPTLTSDPTSNVKITGTTTGNITMAAAGLTDVNTIQITDPLARTIDIGAGNTLRLGSSGGIWHSANASATAITIGVSGSAGTLTAGGATDQPGEITLIGHITESSGPLSSYIVNSVITNNGAGAVRLVIAGSQQDDGSNDTGAVQLNAANTYTGGTYVNSGTLVANDAASFGTGAVTVMPGAQVILNTGGVSNDFFIGGNTATASWNASTHAALRITGNLLSSTITLIGDATIGVTDNVPVAVINSKITGAYNVTFEGTGNVSAGTIRLNNASSDYIGNTSIGRVTLQIGASGAIPHGVGFGDVIFTTNGGTLDLFGNDTTINGLVSNATNPTLVVTNSGGVLSTLTLGEGNGTASFGGTIQDGASPIGITKIGSGTQILTGTGTYSGTTLVSSGVLQAGGTNSFSASSAFNIASSGTLRLGGRDNAIGSLTGSGIVENGSTNSAPNTLTVGADTTSTTFSGTLQNGPGIGPLALTKTGPGIFTVSGVNTYSGATTVTGGILRAGSTSAFGNNSPTTVGFGDILRLDGFDNSIGSLSGSGTVENGAATDATLTTGGLSADSTFSGSLQNGASARLGLIKTGTGTQTLSGSNPYSGTTLVSRGTLTVTGTGSLSASAVTVSPGAKFVYNGASPYTQTLTLNGANGLGNRAILGGSGTISTALILDSKGDVLAPGNSPGILAFTTDQTWSSFSYDWETSDFSTHTAGITHDQISITGTLNLSGGSGSYVLNVISLNALNQPGFVPNFSETNQTWQILTTTGGITGFNASNWSIDTTGFNTSPAYTGTFALQQAGNNLELTYTVTPIPEPSGALLIMVLGLIGILKKRKRLGTAARG